MRLPKNDNNMYNFFGAPSSKQKQNVMIQKKSLAVSLLAMLGMFGFSSCSQDEEVISKQDEKMKEGYEVLVSISSPISMKASSSEVLQSKYTSLAYYYQYNTEPGYNGNYCGHTSYMAATKTVALKNNISYVMNSQTQRSIIDKVGLSPTPYNLFNHWNSYDISYKNYMTCNFARGSNTHPNGINQTTRTKIKEFMENSLSGGKLVIMPVQIIPGNKSRWSNDASVSGSNESSNYISKSGGAGHYIILYRLDRSYNSEGFSVGTAYYLDVYESSSSTCLKSVDYLRLLDANAAASSTGTVYSAMWFDDPNKSLY